ncbi:MBL fold metallo-hydrolase [Actinoplanes sp. NBRC 101535]|uniref:MBL fold metallo-hydrolase n=1 Tax=Actinoplanes sp. NBRC 101535 TaxID=3032196 RepID=UPI0024A2D33C|nr:MBL fold metallo-hydrolase [Actinoplanes sp. NBRC 101535]GLY03705.1 MBL fold metallo-hydrolase [Actinoplanes sp. NBRC 101535]
MEPLDLTVTHVGGPTTIIEIGGVRLLTDPTFDAPGRRYPFGLGTSSVKTAGPAVPASALGRIDAVLLTHHQHGDNLDAAGRALLPGVPRILTTTAGAARLAESPGLALSPAHSPGRTSAHSPDAGPRLPPAPASSSGCGPARASGTGGPGGIVTGLKPWQSVRVGDVEVTATPARHGPPLSRPIVGPAIGFTLRPSRANSVVWITGDTVLFRGLREVGARFTVDTVVLHLGKVQFGVTGPIRYTMTGADAATLIRHLRPRRVVPVHYEGWSHFHEGRAEVEAAFPPGTLTWLTPGDPSHL